MALMVLNGWNNYGAARKVPSWLGTVLVVMENVLVVESTMIESNEHAARRRGEPNQISSVFDAFNLKQFFNIHNS